MPKSAALGRTNFLVMATTLLVSLLALVAPVRCSGCGRRDSALCGRCMESLAAEQVRELEGFVIGGNSIPVVSAGIYAGARRQVILDFKNGGQRRLGRTLVIAVSRTLRSRLVQQNADILVVPVPASIRGGWNRGYSPSLLLAREIAQAIPNARASSIVVPRRRIKAVLRSRFATRSRATRLQRSPSDYVVRARPRAADVIVVDDVAVTGATVRAVCVALVSAGVHPSVVVVAADVPDR